MFNACVSKLYSWEQYDDDQNGKGLVVVVF